MMSGSSQASDSATVTKERPDPRLDDASGAEDLRALVSEMLGGASEEIDPERLFDMVAESLHQTATMLGAMVDSNAAWLAEVEARRQRIDRQIEENWRGLAQLKVDGIP